MAQLMLITATTLTAPHWEALMQESDFFKQLKAAQPFFIMAGPNVIQSEEHVLKLARQIKAVTDKLGLLLVFKCSFDKANRTSATSFRGPGLEEGLRSADSWALNERPGCSLVDEIGSDGSLRVL